MSNEAVVAVDDKVVYASLDQMVESGATVVEYRTIKGFKEGEWVRIGSVNAGDMIEWSEAEGQEAKRTAGLRLICKSLVGPEKPDPKLNIPPNYRYAANTDKMGESVSKLRAMRHKETERIVKEILDLNGLDVKKGKDAKNE
jgi:hypothetical protein